MAMLRIFKAASLQTSILDDFLIYEERQRILFEEKSRISGRRQHNPQYFPPPFLPSADFVAERETIAAAAASATESAEKEASFATHKAAEPHRAESNERQTLPDENGVDSKPPSKPTNLVILGHSKEQFDDGADSIMKIGSLLIDSDAGEDLPSSTSQNDVITVGSMHIKVGKPAPPL